MLSLRTGRQFFSAASEDLRIFYSLIWKVSMRKGVRGFKPFKGLPFRDFFFPMSGEKKKGSTWMSETRSWICFGPKCVMNVTVTWRRDGAASYTQEVRGWSEAVGISMQTQCWQKYELHNLHAGQLDPIKSTNHRPLKTAMLYVNIFSYVRFLLKPCL